VRHAVLVAAHERGRGEAGDVEGSIQTGQRREHVVANPPCAAHDAERGGGH